MKSINIGDREVVTMTVGDLRSALKQHDPDLPVLVTWEGILVELHDGCLQVANTQSAAFYLEIDADMR